MADFSVEPGDVLVIDGSKYEVAATHDYGCYRRSTYADTEGGDYYIYEDRDDAGKDTYDYWEDMAHNDRGEFIAIIGEERLLEWALGNSDDFGISSAQEFFERNADVPEETLASYDSEERECVLRVPVDADGERIDRTYEDDEQWQEFECVAYRCN